MSSILNVFDTDTNFWKSNKQLLLSEVFKEFHNGDKSKNKSKSSKIMWGVAMLVDSSDANKFKNLPFDTRRTLISEEWFKNKEYDWDDIKDIVNEFRMFCLSPAERMLHDALEKMEERSQFLKDTPYTLDNANLLDGMQKNTKIIYDNLKKIEDDLANEAKGLTRGGAEESASEKGLI